MRHMTRAEFARHMKVNRSTVTRWIERGRIVATADGRIDSEAAKRALEATESPEPHHQARSAQIAEEKAQRARRRGGETREVTEIGLRLKLAMAKEREAKAQLAALEVDRQAGLLVEREQVDFILKDIGTTLRTAVDGLADRLAPQLAGHGGDVAKVHAGLDDAARDLLHEISDHIERRSEALGK